MLQCCNNDDTVTLKAEGNAADQMTLEFENESQDRISVFNLNLMDINAEHLHIPGAAPRPPPALRGCDTWASPIASPHATRGRATPIASPRGDRGPPVASHRVQVRRTHARLRVAARLP